MTWEIFFSDDPDPVARQQNVQRCIQSLVHACQCSDANCQPSCQRMKRVLTHAKTCKRQFKGDCPICKHLRGLCDYHAKYCKEAKCSVLYCSSIKQKQKLQQEQKKQQQEKQEERELQQCRRMAAIKRCYAAAAKKPSPPPAKPVQPAPHLILIQLQRTEVPSQQQPEAPQRQALQQLVAALRSPANHSQHQQILQILQILKSNPALLVAFIKQTAQDSQNQEQAGGDVSIENVGVGNVYVALGRVGNVNAGVGHRPSGAGVVNAGLRGEQRPQRQQMHRMLN